MWGCLVGEVWPNLFASLLWAPLAFGASHVLLRRHITATMQPPPSAPDGRP